MHRFFASLRMTGFDLPRMKAAIKEKCHRMGWHFLLQQLRCYRDDSISKPQASSSASGMYFEFLFLRAHSRKRVERMY